MSIHQAATLKSQLPLGNAALRQSEFSLSLETRASYKSAVNGSTPSLGLLAGSNSYFLRPNSPYRVFAVAHNGEWYGYIVIRMLERWGLQVGTLVDLFFDPNFTEAGKVLIAWAEEELRGEGANALWGLLALPKGYQRLFTRAGFFKTLRKRTERPFHLLADFISIKHFRPDLAARDGALLRQEDQWFLSLGDADLA